MGIVQAFTGAVAGTMSDQWRDVITAGPFAEYTVVAPGVFMPNMGGRSGRPDGLVDTISNGSRIFVPENTAAVIFGQAGIEEIIARPGGYEYRSGQPSVFGGNAYADAIVNQVRERFGFGGQNPNQKHLSFVNMREIRGLKFGTRGPMVYHDRFYNADLEVQAFGTFSIRVVDPVTFVRNFLPANVRSYAFDRVETRQQIAAEFIQAFIVAVNSLSATHRVSELPSQVGAIAQMIADDSSTLGSWITRYGLDVVHVGIESIELSPESRELVRQYSTNRMSLSAYENASQQASNIAAQQKVAQGVQDHGLGEGGGAVFGVNLAQAMNPLSASPSTGQAAGQGASGGSLEEQIESVRKLKDLVDEGILTQEEFEAKKKQVLGL